jgi:hypothetical protein
MLPILPTQYSLETEHRVSRSAAAGAEQRYYEAYNGGWLAADGIMRRVSRAVRRRVTRFLASSPQSNAESTPGTILDRLDSAHLSRPTPCIASHSLHFPDIGPGSHWAGYL